MVQEGRRVCLSESVRGRGREESRIFRQAAKSPNCGWRATRLSPVSSAVHPPAHRFFLLFPPRAPVTRLDSTRRTVEVSASCTHPLRTHGVNPDSHTVRESQSNQCLISPWKKENPRLANTPSALSFLKQSRLRPTRLSPSTQHQYTHASTVQ